jgi:hypothetical protein
MALSSRLAGIFMVWALVAGGCGGGGDIGSCDTREAGLASELGTCRTWHGEKTASTSDFRDLCTDVYEGAFSSDGCPEDGVVGTCETDQGFGLLMDIEYYESHHDPPSAQDHCESQAACQFGCTFVPAPAAVR